MKAKDVMTHRVATISDRQTLADAARLMWDRSCGFIPVTSGGRLAGVVTDRDVCMGGLTQGTTLDRIPVRVSMTAHPSSCHEDDSLETVEGIMRDRRVRRLPVVSSGGQVVGVISLDDLARLLLDPDLKDQRTQLAQDVAKTLGLVSQPPPFQVLQEICAHHE